MPWTPAATARSASSTVWIPLSTIGPDHTDCSHSTSDHASFWSKFIITYCPRPMSPSLPYFGTSPTLAKVSGSCALNHVSNEPAVLPGVHLEPLGAVAHGGDLLDRARAHRRQGVRDAGPLRRARDRQLALRMGEPRVSRGRQHERHRHRLAEQRGRDVDLADITQHVRTELDSAERRRVVGERALVLGTAVDVIEHAVRETTLGDATHVLDRDRGAQTARDGVGLELTEANDGAERVPCAHGRGPYRSPEFDGRSVTRPPARQYQFWSSMCSRSRNPSSIRCRRSVDQSGWNAKRMSLTSRSV